MEAALLRWPMGFVQKFSRCTWHIADGWLAMNSIAIIQRLHKHRRWVNENLLAAANPLSDEQLHRSFPMGQGSIWKSLVHLYAAEFVCRNESPRSGIISFHVPDRVEPSRQRFSLHK